MIGMILAALIGVVQFFLSKSVFGGILKLYSKKRAAICALIKVILYVISFVLLVFVFKNNILLCGIGFAIGLPGSAVVYFIYNLLFNGGNSDNEYGNGN